MLDPRGRLLHAAVGFAGVTAEKVRRRRRPS
jgi:hypothetical protein